MLRSLATLATLFAMGCGGRPESAEQGGAPVVVESRDQADTSGLSAGPPLLRKLDVFRDPSGALRTRGQLELPDGTRLQFSIYPPQGGPMLARTQFNLQDGRFESPPLNGRDGPLPEAVYRFQLVTYFDPAWQPPAVMEATDDGHALRGPGVTLGHRGRVGFVHEEDLRR